MRKLSFILLALTLSACSQVPSIVYHPPVQQGNEITSATVAQLRLGMTQDQVVEILGEPVLKDPFNDNRWFYVYTYMNNHAKMTKYKRLTLYFNDSGVLTSFKSTVTPDPRIAEANSTSPSGKKPAQTDANQTILAPVSVNKMPTNSDTGSNLPDVSLPTPDSLGN